MKCHMKERVINDKNERSKFVRREIKKEDVGGMWEEKGIPRESLKF